MRLSIIKVHLYASSERFEKDDSVKVTGFSETDHLNNLLIDDKEKNKIKEKGRRRKKTHFVE